MKKSSGMTLLEVLVALAIFAVAAVAVINALSQQARNLNILEEKTFAGWVAENQMVDLRLAQLWSNGEWFRGQTEMASVTWYWSWHGIPTADPRLQAVDVEVSQFPPLSETENGIPSITLRSYMVKP